MEGGNAIGMKIRIGGKRPSTPEPARHLGTSLPIRWHEDRSIPAAAALTLFGGFWAAVSLSGLYVMLSDVQREDRVAGILLTAVFSLVGAVIFLAGLNGFFLRTFIWIDASKVRFKRRALIWGAADWTEPLSAFRGVLASRKYRSGDDSHILCRIHLKHARDPERDIELYRARWEGLSGGETEHRVETERFARLLGVPVLAEEEDGAFSARESADLDKSVRQRAEEGSLNVPSFDLDAVSAESGLHVRRTSQGYVFEASLMPLLKVAVILFGVGLGSIYWYFGPGLPPGEGQDWVVPVVGTMCAMVSSVLAWLALFRVERLEVSHRGVRVGAVEPGSTLGDANADFMKTDEIEEVTLQRNKFRRFQVVIGGDRQTLRWGEWISKREREMVRDAIIQTLAR